MKHTKRGDSKKSKAFLEPKVARQFFSFWCAENLSDFPAKAVSWLIVFLVVGAMMVSAQPEEASETSCSGFWGSNGMIE